MHVSGRVAVMASLLLVACGPVASQNDSGSIDSGASTDASVAVDAGREDAGTPDGGVLDSGVTDAGVTDAGVTDAGVIDAGLPDAGAVDAGTCFDFGCTSGMCCAAACVDTQTSNTHCGACNAPCAPTAANTQAQCGSGTCQRSCAAGFYDCDGNTANGCESSTVCLCVPGATSTCYEGAQGTQNIGLCHGGMKTCASSGLAFGPCSGQVTPVAEVCADGLDQNCNGVADDALDEDGDGFTACSGDCCDNLSQCANPAAVGPRSFEVTGNSIDDDCDGTTDVVTACDTGLATAASASDSALAMGLCQTTTQNGARWGVITSSYTRSNGTSTPAAASHAIRPRFGTNNQPLEGASLLVLSTGPAAATGDTGADANLSTNFAITSTLPSDWLAANGNQVPVPAGCGAISLTAYDPVLYRLSVRVPANARSFSVRAKLLTTDYPEAVCSPYADQFIALLDSSYVPQGTQPANPADKNFAAATVATTSRTLSANLASGNSGYFTECVNGATGCGGGVAGSYTACTSTSSLAGTGFEVAAANSCDANSLRGGGTGWLNLSANVVPGEVIVLRLVLWDVSDANFDSTVLLDAFQWSTSNVTAGASL